MGDKLLLASEKTPSTGIELFSRQWRQGLFATAFVVAVPLPALLIAFGRVNGAATLVLAGVTGMLLTRLEDVESFALGPLKAELRRQIAVAAVTVEQLQSLGAALAAPALASLRTPRMGSGPSPRQYSAKEEIVSQLRSLGSTEGSIRDATTLWRRGAEMDHQDIIAEEMDRRLEAADPSMAYQASLVCNPLRDRTSLGEDIPAEEFASIAARFGLTGKEVDEAILDLEHFKKTDVLRRPNVFPGISA